WYTGLLAAALLLFSLTFYSFLQQTFLAEVERTIKTQAEEIAAVIAADNDPVSVLLSGRASLPPIIDVFASAQIFVQIRNRDGTIVQRSTNLGNSTLPSKVGIFLKNLRGQPQLYYITAGDVRLLAYSVPIQLQDGRVIGVVEVAQSLRDKDATLQVVRLGLFGGSAIALLVAAVVGGLLARVALRPIDEITQTALRITRREDLSQRLPNNQPQDEVGRLAATFNEMLERLERLFQTQQRLIADVSHELRTPLTTLRGELDLLKRGAIEDPALRAESLAAMEAETARMSRMVADLLLLAQADAGLKLAREPVEMDTLLLDVYRQAQIMARETGGDHGPPVEVHLGHEDQAQVLGDPDRLKQLLLNLVDNAIKYTPGGGQVTLSLYREQDWVRVEVSDTGIGIRPEDLPHIFERFYRVNKGGPRRTSGSGLGLSIARWIAESHGGRLTVQSQVGVGSTFTVWLPLREVRRRST
ncbi:MAG TPA: sensor histidine kinase, partial [Anaerolineae bacterium]|nr:sensor histidine kinase [Anaerolineae bacterium]HIQ04907.1 sensor histidine kinase [Anaerolineae bacterium]